MEGWGGGVGYGGSGDVDVGLVWGHLGVAHWLTNCVGWLLVLGYLSSLSINFFWAIFPQRTSRRKPTQILPRHTIQITYQTSITTPLFQKINHIMLVPISKPIIRMHKFNHVKLEINLTIIK